MDNRPVGIFDSGLGGLTAAAALRELLPNENIIYFADTGRCPYGPRPVPQLRKMAEQNIKLLTDMGAKAIICACGTMSTNAIDILRSSPVYTANVLDASISAMSRVSGNGPLAVIATEAAIKSGVFCSRIQEAAPDREVIAAACQSFVRLCESGHTAPDDPELVEYTSQCLGEIKNKKPNALLLGCTHFGIVSEAIRNFLGDDVELIEASACGSGTMADYLRQNDMTGTGGQTKIYTSGNADEFRPLAVKIFGDKFDIEAEHIPPMEA